MRVRWFEVASGAVSLQALRTKLLKDEYRANRSFGFRLEPAVRGSLSGRFIERLEYEIEVEDPFGNTESQARVEYRQLHFEILESAPHIQVDAPPRTCKFFLERLSEHLGADVQVRSPAVPLERWLAALERHTPHVEVHLLEVSNINLSGTTHARVLVAGVEDVRRAQSAFLQGHNATLERVGVTWAGGAARCELTGLGRALVELGESAQITRLLREALGAASKMHSVLPS